MTKSTANFKAQRKKENYTKQAKKDNIRARSYFKLQQLDNKFELINDNMTIIDLGCAPGGWLQYIDSKVTKGKIVGIDLLTVPKHDEFSERVEIIEDDFDNIEDYVSEKFDLVLSDMAPEFSGNAQVDKGRTHKLNLKVLEFCREHLKGGSNCAFKSFEGEDLEYVIKKAKEMFQVVKHYKPASSQKKSAEVFVVCFVKHLR